MARGGIVDEAALADAVREGVIAGAALDVFDAEPTTSSPLFELESIVVTPHLGASTREAQDKAGDTIADMVQLALAGEFVPFEPSFVLRATNGVLFETLREQGGPGRMRQERPLQAADFVLRSLLVDQTRLADIQDVTRRRLRDPEVVTAR